MSLNGITWTFLGLRYRCCANIFNRTVLFICTKYITFCPLIARIYTCCLWDIQFFKFLFGFSPGVLYAYWTLVSNYASYPRETNLK